jgi:hypothetical protein
MTMLSGDRHGVTRPTSSSRAPALGGFTVHNKGGSWELAHERAGYLVTLTFEQVRTFIAGRYDTAALLRGELVEVGNGKHTPT